MNDFLEQMRNAIYIRENAKLGRIVETNDEKLERQVHDWLFEDNSSDTLEQIIDKILFATKSALGAFQGMASEITNEAFGGKATIAAKYAQEITDYLKRTNELFFKAKEIVKPVENKTIFKLDIEVMATNMGSANSYANSVDKKDVNHDVLMEYYTKLSRQVWHVGNLLHQAELPTPEIKNKDGEVIVEKYDPQVQPAQTPTQGSPLKFHYNM